MILKAGSTIICFLVKPKVRHITLRVLHYSMFFKVKEGSASDGRSLLDSSLIFVSLHVGRGIDMGSRHDEINVHIVQSLLPFTPQS